jgi:hypothetical protein
MEGFKGLYSISEYSVSQTTLEQIFNNFAKEAEVGNQGDQQRKRTTVMRKPKNMIKDESSEFRLKSEKYA